jgi:hypothetical protein
MNEINDTIKGGEREPKLNIRHACDTTNVTDSVEAKITFETVDGIIVLLDALGTKGRWKREHPAKVLENWSLLQREAAVRVSFVIEHCQGLVTGFIS